MFKPSYLLGMVADFSEKPSGPLLWMRMANTVLPGMIRRKLKAWTRWWNKHVCTSVPLAILQPPSPPPHHILQAELQSPPFLHTPLPTHSHQIPKASRSLERCWHFRNAHHSAASEETPCLPTFFSFPPLPRPFSASSVFQLFPLPPSPGPASNLFSLPSIWLHPWERGRDRVQEEHCFGLKQHRLEKTSPRREGCGRSGTVGLLIKCSVWSLYPDPSNGLSTPFLGLQFWGKDLTKAEEVWKNSGRVWKRGQEYVNCQASHSQCQWTLGLS